MSKITIHQHTIRNERRWVVGMYRGGKRIRTICETKEQAEREAARMKDTVTLGAIDWNLLGKSEQARLLLIYEECKKREIDPLQTVMNSQIVESSPAPVGPTLDAVIDDLIKTKEKAGRAKAYTQSLECILGDFSKGREAQRFAAVSLADVETYLDAKSIESRSTLRARLSTLFKFGVKRGLRADNPCNGLETVTVRRAPPQILSTAEVKSCLDWLAADHKSGAAHSPWFNYRHALTWFALSTACGLRPEEAEQIRKENIHIEEGWIAISEEITKVGMRRVVSPRPEAMALLARVMPYARWPLGHQAKRQAVRKLRNALGWKTWPKDVTRHTAASNWLGAGATAGEVSEHLGNSPDVLKRRYKALRTRQQSEEFWKLIGTWEMPVTIKEQK